MGQHEFTDLLPDFCLLECFVSFVKSVSSGIARRSLLGFIGKMNGKSKARERLDALYGHYDILLSPSAPGAAPPSLETTGDSVFNRLWTAMQTPSISIPAGFSTTGMPLGIQLVGQRYADYSLLANASLIAEAIAVPLRQPAFA